MTLAKTSQLTSLALQLAIIGPMNLAAPFALIFGPVLALKLFSNQHITSEDIAFAFGWIGLIGLYTSIFVSPSRVERRPVLKAIISVLPIFGIVLSGLLLKAFNTSNSPGSDPDLIEDAVALWYLGGPVVLAVINLYRMHVYCILRDFTEGVRYKGADPKAIQNS